jgi:hypothetical protein
MKKKLFALLIAVLVSLLLVVPALAELPPPTLPTDWEQDPIFQDTFNRANSMTVGNGWTEYEASGGAQPYAQVWDRDLRFKANKDEFMPIVTHNLLSQNIFTRDRMEVIIGTKMIPKRWGSIDPGFEIWYQVGNADAMDDGIAEGDFTKGVAASLVLYDKGDGNICLGKARTAATYPYYEIFYDRACEPLSYWGLDGYHFQFFIDLYMPYKLFQIDGRRYADSGGFSFIPGAWDLPDYSDGFSDYSHWEWNSWTSEDTEYQVIDQLRVMANNYEEGNWKYRDIIHGSYTNGVLVNVGDWDQGTVWFGHDCVTPPHTNPTNGSVLNCVGNDQLDPEKGCPTYLHPARKLAPNETYEYHNYSTEGMGLSCEPHVAVGSLAGYPVSCPYQDDINYLYTCDSHQPEVCSFPYGWRAAHTCVENNGVQPGAIDNSAILHSYEDNELWTPYLAFHNYIGAVTKILIPFDPTMPPNDH